MSYTKGPWKLEHDWQEQPGAIIILSADGEIVADAWAPRAERVANARLIAAAPELLEACKTLLRCVKGSPDDHTLDVAVSAGYAVAKAETLP